MSYYSSPDKGAVSAVPFLADVWNRQSGSLAAGAGEIPGGVQSGVWNSIGRLRRNSATHFGGTFRKQRSIHVLRICVSTWKLAGFAYPPNFFSRTKNDRSLLAAIMAQL
jgi:hypothetical protein